MSKFETKYGYFTDDGNEYVIKSPRTPKPWINVISNGDYGLTASQTGGGFSWLTHSEFNRITRWHQDLIKDDWGKYIYLKNNSTGEVWSPTWSIVKTELKKYECRHGFGYTIYESEFRNIKITLTIFVPMNDSLEVWNLKIKNNSGQKVSLSIFTYFEWVLGSSNDHHREFHKQFVETKFDDKLNSIIAKKRIWDIPIEGRGHWNTEYKYTGFFASSVKPESFDCDKESFIGQYCSLQNPAALEKGLEKKAGLFYDPIASFHTLVELENESTNEINYFLGLKENENEIASTIENYLRRETVAAELKKVKDFWLGLLGNLEVSTPDDAMNIGVNKWFRYQAIAGRLWGRTAYYQQSGAFGFRDQLQDSLVFLPVNPNKTAEQIRLHARHQFEDGTVLHWWHPITESGLETKMTDDLLWLPFLCGQYLDETNDYDLLKIEEPFYKSETGASIYEHCKRAIDKVFSRMSERGLPLIGAGDWNDGLSAVGLEMKGESFWLAEFLYFILNRFSGAASKIGDNSVGKKYFEAAKELKQRFNEYCWDGEWFARGTKDSGEMLGSRTNKEGRLYLNPQTWSVISGIASSDSKRKAMDSVKSHLLKKNGCLLLSPAYSKPDEFIGYLSRYAPGRRENGGVYSHAAAWAVWAYAKLEDNSSAFESYKNLNPILSGMKPDEYRAEPYVMPGNIDGPDSPIYGMAGWTWYTGSAAWFQKVIVEWILGVRPTEDGLLIDPCIPNKWTVYKVKRFFRGTNYNIEVLNEDGVSGGVRCLEIDGIEQESNLISPTQKKELIVKVYLGKREK